MMIDDIYSFALWKISDRKGIFVMIIQNSPQIGDTLFLINKEVVVISVYALFRLATVRYLGETKEFGVDFCALSRKPDCTNTISLRLFKEGMP